MMNSAAEPDPEELAGLMEAGQSYPVWSPYDAFAAAEVLLRCLEADRTLVALGL
jgi:hypothetical protein